VGARVSSKRIRNSRRRNSGRVMKNRKKIRKKRAAKALPSLPFLLNERLREVLLMRGAILRAVHDVDARVAAMNLDGTTFAHSMRDAIFRVEALSEQIATLKSENKRMRTLIEGE
jgi:hypothetical protein